MSEFLFVYGTLLPQIAPDELQAMIRRLHISDHATVRGWLYDLGAYPGAILFKEPLKDETTARIHGAVFEIPEEILMTLDDYEGFHAADITRSLFIRRNCIATLNSKKQISCWIYEYNRLTNAAQLIVNGNYLTYLASKRAVNNQKYCS